MIIHPYHKILLILLSLVLSSCLYEPGGENFEPVQPLGEVPTLEVDLNINSDTVYIHSALISHITFTSEDTLLKTAQVYLDERLHTTVHSSNGEFFFSLNNQAISVHHLKINFFKRSGTGSIADQAGAEGFVFSKSWVVLVKRGDQLNSMINKFTPMEGSLKIEWTKYHGIGFKEYQIFHGNEIGQIADTVAIVKDVNTTSCFDPSFVGYKLQYIIRVVTDEYTFPPVFSYFEDKLPPASVTTNSDGKFIIKWEQSKYFNNIKEYDIYETFTNQSDVNKIATVSSSAGLQYVNENSKFGIATRFYITPVPKTRFRPTQMIYEFRKRSSSTKVIVLGDSISPYMQSEIATPLGDHCYYQKLNYICKYNSKTAIEEQFPFNPWSLVRVSPNGKYLLVYSEEKFILYNTEDMSVISTTTQKDISGYTMDPYNIYYKFSVSDNGIGVYYNHGLLLYDFINKKLLHRFSIRYPDSGLFIKISSNGNYVAFNSTSNGTTYTTYLYKVENSSITQLFEANGQYFDFDPVNKQNFIYFNNNKLITKSLTGLNTLHEISLNAKNVSCVDFNTLEAVTISPEINAVNIIDINTGKLKFTVPTFDYDETDYVNSYYFSNHTLFVFATYLNGGYKLQLTY